ncbi:hypothetical protein [Delftia acidovorans]|uniref:hypothetical protein n=1 Tax=Delftia acidovorans TaxID=80866 RepID=UPI0028AFA241|nr:hypothetical protein [Delftia acidovorans]
MKAIEKQFSQWVDETLSGDLQEGIAAFHFNLYDSPTSHELQIVGCPTYDPQDPDWACDDIFMSDDPHFELPHEVVGSDWEKGLAAARKLLGSYVASEATGALRLRQSQAVSAGFVDGELHLIWARDA